MASSSTDNMKKSSAYDNQSTTLGEVKQFLTTPPCNCNLITRVKQSNSITSFGKSYINCPNFAKGCKFLLWYSEYEIIFKWAANYHNLGSPAGNEMLYDHIDFVAEELSIARQELRVDYVSFRMKAWKEGFAAAMIVCVFVFVVLYVFNKYWSSMEMVL